MDDVFAFYSEEGPFSSQLVVDSLVHDAQSNVSYKLLELLGSGSYAQVFLARDIEHSRDVALKCLSKSNLSISQLELQLEEVAIHKSLGVHPNIVTLYSSFETDNWLFLVLEFCGRVDLYTYITDDVASSHPHIQFDQLCSIFRQMIDAVAYCHRSGVFHRDLKPENFMVVESDKFVTVKLTDFGLATTENYCDDFECGSKPYMSYECRNGYDLPHYSSIKSDVWALGVMFLNLFYCRCPWDDPDAVANLAFVTFIKEGAKFLIEQFGCSHEVAEFLASMVFCDEHRRCDVSQLQAFCKLLKPHDVYVDLPARRSHGVSSIASLISETAKLKPYLTVSSGQSSDYPINMPIPINIAGAYLSPPTSPNGSIQLPALSWSEIDDDDEDDWALSLPSFASPPPINPKCDNVAMNPGSVCVLPYTQ